jgi:hypothetical protein
MKSLKQLKRSVAANGRYPRVSIGKQEVENDYFLSIRAETPVQSATLLIEDNGRTGRNGVDSGGFVVNVSRSKFEYLKSITDEGYRNLNTTHKLEMMIEIEDEKRKIATHRIPVYRLRK